MIKLLRTTIAGGILFLIPFVVLYAVVAKALSITRRLLEPIQHYLPIDSLAGFEKPYILSVLLLLAVCAVLGTLAKTSLAKKTTSRMEGAFLNKIPGYLFLKNIAEEVVIGNSTGSFPAVLVHFDDNAQLGFLIEQNAEFDQSIVFVPGAPNPTSGNVFVVTSKRVTMLEESSIRALQTLQRLGAGTSSLIKGQFMHSGGSG